MKRIFFSLFLAALMLLPAGISAFAPETEDVTIQISPNVLNLDSSGTVFTVHTDLPFSQVVGASCSINDVPIDWWKSDSQGDFVAKFDIDAVKGLSGLIIGGLNEFTLSGLLVDGTEFSGSQSIKIIAVSAKGR